MMKRDKCFQLLARHFPDDVVVSTYSSAFEWARARPHPLNYVSVGAMGLASSHALGLALSRPDRRVVVFDGDGSLLMNLASLVTVVEAAPANLIHFVCENGNYEANGGHPIPGLGKMDFVEVARAIGFRNVARFASLEQIERDIDELLALRGPVFVSLLVETGEPIVPNYQWMHSRQVRDDFKAALLAARPRPMGARPLSMGLSGSHPGQ